MAEQTCYRCAGSGVIEKQRHTVELDGDGNQIARHESYLGPCNSCGGTGKVH